MKYLCPGCERLVEPDDLHVLPSAVELRCPKCGALERVERPRRGGEPPHPAGNDDDGKLGDGPPAASAEEKCPKCSAPRGAGESCPKCGLVYVLWTGDVQDAPDGLAEEWARVEASWDDDDAHRRFVSRALELGALAYAARCYRSRDDARSREQLEQLTQLGVQAMQMSETPGRLNPRLFRTVGWIVFFVLCLTLAAIMLSFR